jgi:7-cyano-7-deazaguanine synthase in queuosine biosynthesis
MKNSIDAYEQILINKRGYVSRLPENRKVVMIISGGLDSIVTSARLILDYKMELFPMHIHRGQTNAEAENGSVDFFTQLFQQKFGRKKFHQPMKINVNVPPSEFKRDLLEYSKAKGHPLRDTIMQLVAVQYAIAVSAQTKDTIKTIFTATGPEDPFPHCSLLSFRINTINACENLGDWGWLISSPNIDENIFGEPFGKTDEIAWAAKNGIPIENTVSCYKPVLLGGKFHHCGECLACRRRKKAFSDAGLKDLTNYLK